jgi:hypothetical protein
MSTRQKNKTTSADRAANLAAGTKKRFPNPNDNLEFGGATYTVASVIATLQSVVDLRGAVVAAQAAAKAKVQAETLQLPQLVPFIGAYTSFVRSRFGNSPEALGDFGLSPHKAPAPLTAEQKAVAVAKRDATRTARGTRSAKQKKGIHGQVEVSLVVKPAAEPVPAPAVTNGAPSASK